MPSGNSPIVAAIQYFRGSFINFRRVFFSSKTFIRDFFKKFRRLIPSKTPGVLKKYETLEKIPEIFYKSSEETTERISEFKKKFPKIYLQEVLINSMKNVFFLFVYFK